MGFETLIGNEQNKELLTNIASGGNVLHSYMFVGQTGIGKFLFAKEFAKMLLCLDKGQKPCNKCKSCIEFENNNNPDFYCLNPEGNSIKVETIRVAISKTIEKPIISNRKLYIINDSELMTREAQNTLLKTLEEPAEFITIILIVQNENQILNTIKSRCMKINFNNINDKQLKSYLENNHDFSNISENLLKSFGGSIEKALGMREHKEIYSKIEEIFLNLEKIDKIDIIKNDNPIYSAKDNIIDALDYINIIFFEEIKKKNNTNSIKIKQYLNCIDIVNDTKVKLNRK